MDGEIQARGNEMKVSTTWKLVEAKVAARFGLKRRGADYGDRDGGKSDATELDGSESARWSLEVKHGKRHAYQSMLDACRQAEEAAHDGQEPVAVIHRVGERYGDSLVVQRLETFEAWRLGGQK